MTHYARYYTFRQQGSIVHLLTISNTPNAAGGTTYKVESKKAARALAVQHNAKPWNF